MKAKNAFLILTFALIPHAAIAQTPIADESAAIAEAAQRFAAGGKPVTITADRLQALLADPAKAPMLISVCAPDDFAKAHIPGSINIPRGAFFKPAQLAKLPPRDRPIVTYCYTGTGAVGPATVLNLMGYDAAQLEWGMMGWSRNDAGLGPATRFPQSQQKFPVVSGPQGTAITYARPVIVTGRPTLNQPRELARLPLGRRIVVADYNGQAAVGISYLLSILGYNARGLQYGMMGWTADDTVMGPFKRFPADQRDFPIESKR